MITNNENLNNINKIPKIIHQIWFQGKNDIPKDYPNYSSSWKKYNPDYKYIFWDKEKIENLMHQYFPEFVEKYNKLPKMIQKIDSAKWMILYSCGGIYADMDSECLKNFDNLLDNNVILSKCNMNLFQTLLVYGTPNDVIQTGLMISIKNHPLWKKCIELILKEDINQGSFELDEKYIFRTTVTIVTNAYHSYNDKKNILLLDHNYIDPLTSCEYELENCYIEDCGKHFPKAYAFHHYGAKHSTHGWLTGGMKNSLMFLCKNQMYIYSLFCFCFFSIIVIIVYFLKFYR